MKRFQSILENLPETNYQEIPSHAEDFFIINSLCGFNFVELDPSCRDPLDNHSVQASIESNEFSNVTEHLNDILCNDVLSDIITRGMSTCHAIDLNLRITSASSFHLICDDIYRHSKPFKGEYNIIVSRQVAGVLTEGKLSLNYGHDISTMYQFGKIIDDRNNNAINVIVNRALIYPNIYITSGLTIHYENKIIRKIIKNISEGTLFFDVRYKIEFH